MTITRAARLGFDRAITDLYVQLRTGLFVQWLGWNLLIALVLYFLRNHTVMGSQISIGAVGVAGGIASGLFFGGVFGVGVKVTVDRKDGTLLRAKTTPGGLVSYLVGSLVSFTALGVFSVFPLLVCAALWLPESFPAGVKGWFLFVVFLALGVVTTTGLGVALGAGVRSVGQLWPFGLASYALVAISGLFYPIKALPELVQGVAQVFPLYWLGVGLRAGMLAPAGQVLETGGVWAVQSAVVVLIVWSVVSVVLAVFVMRRATAKQSCATVERAQADVVGQAGF